MKPNSPIRGSRRSSTHIRGKAAREALALRKLIFDTAAQTEGVGELEETLKWGQPSYLTPETKSGSTIRIDGSGGDGRCAVYFICHTNLVESFRELYATRSPRGQRA